MFRTDDAWKLDRFFASDRACDGRFIVGVVTTGIYCLPSCRARKPRPANVRFFDTVDAARASGLRSCRRCRPDDFYRRHDPDRDALNAFVEQIRRDPSHVPDPPPFGATKANALFRRYFDTTPAAFVQRERIAAACRRLRETDDRIIDIAFGVGFASLSAFQENFVRHTGQTPAAFRDPSRKTAMKPLTCTFDTTIGPLRATLNDDVALIELAFAEPPVDAPIPSAFTAIVTQIREYLAGARVDFDLPLAPTGTPFQKQVWEELRRVPHGTTITYRELAERIGRPTACRAVGGANGANPIAIIIPCHRVIGANGTLTGYAHGVTRKERLLALERSHGLKTHG